MKTANHNYWRLFNSSLVVFASLSICWAEGNPTLVECKPVASQVIEVMPFEADSRAPWGSQRIGGREDRSFVISPNGKLLLSRDAGLWQVECWDLSNGKSLGKFGRFDVGTYSLAISPDNELLAIAEGERSSRYDSRRVEIWKLTTREKIAGLDEGVNFVPFGSLAFSPNGKHLALGAGLGSGEKGVHFWSVEGGEVGHLNTNIPGEPVALNGESFPHQSVCYSPDGRSLAVAKNSSLRLYEISTGQMRGLVGFLPPWPSKKERTDKMVRGLAFAPDGSHLAVACGDGLIRIWNLNQGSELPALFAHDAAVEAVRFSGDGRWLWSFGRDNRLLTFAMKDVTGLVERESVVPIEASALKETWESLLKVEGLARLRACEILYSQPNETVTLVSETLRPVPQIDVEQANQWVDELGSADFNVRRRAAIELRKLGDLAVPLLLKTQEREVGVRFDYEAQERKRGFANSLRTNFPTDAQLQSLRGIYLLERIGSPRALELLRRMAGGAVQSEITNAATLALARLEKRLANAQTIAQDVPNSIWEILGNSEPEAAYNSIRGCLRHPDEAVRLLSSPLIAIAKMPAEDDPDRIKLLISELDSSTYSTRENAFESLRELGVLAKPALQSALERSKGLEQRKRIESLLALPDKQPDKKLRMQVDRTLEVLERVGTEPARQAMQTAHSAAQSQWIKQAILESLQRVKQREIPPGTAVE